MARKKRTEIAAYLQDRMDEAGGDPAVIAAALGEIARAHGMMKLSKETGLTREALYRALSPKGNPNFGTILKVTKALGIKLVPKAA
jgi:probable addiction module antidote protein